MDSNTKFYVSHNGDRSVGIWGETATVEFDRQIEEEDELEAIREILEAAFQEIFDFKAYAQTEEEHKIEMDGFREQNDPAYLEHLRLTDPGNPVSINETDKIADTLAKACLHNNDYHRAIQETARILVENNLGHYRYHTQWGSGTCCYRSPDGIKAVTVNPDTGRIY